MKLLLDQGTPLRTAARLRAVEWEVIHTREIGLADAQDEAIIIRAQAEGRSVVTLDADFHQILATTGAVQPSVIRIEGLSYDSLGDLLQRELPIREDALLAGCAISINKRGVRIRKLPLLASAKG